MCQSGGKCSLGHYNPKICIYCQDLIYSFKFSFTSEYTTKLLRPFCYTSGTSLCVFIPELSCQDVDFPHFLPSLSTVGKTTCKNHLSISICFYCRVNLGSSTLENVLSDNNQTVKQYSSCVSTHLLSLLIAKVKFLEVQCQKMLCTLGIFSYLEAWERMSLFFLGTAKGLWKTFQNWGP